MYQLTFAKKQDIRAAQLGHRFDEELLHQCAYYPRPSAFNGESPCIRCSFEEPYRKCKWAHILNDTRVGREVWTSPPRSLSTKREKSDPKMKLAIKLGFNSWEELIEEAKRFGGIVR